MTIKVFLLWIICVIPHGYAKDCTRKDIKRLGFECDTTTRLRKVVRYVDSSCDLKDVNLIKPYNISCVCDPGSGLTDDENPQCTKCKAGTYSAGGEDLSDWSNWPRNSSKQQTTSEIVTFCETYRSYVKSCDRWKPSFFNDSLESGDNSQTRCMSSTLMIRKQFVGAKDNYVNFTYRVEGRQCYNNYVGCDGLSFYIDNTQVMKAEGNVFLWKQVSFNVSAGYHELKFVYRKNCYSFPVQGIADKAFIQSITLVGTSDPNTKCKACPPGTYSKTTGATKCIKCDYFEEQPDSGQQSCSLCQKDGYSMPGSQSCIPKLNCTNDDLIKAPESLKTCKPYKNGVLVRNVISEYVTVRIKGKPYMLCKNEGKVPPPTPIPCRCQPGYELNPKTLECHACSKGKMSKDGQKCQTCPSGSVAVMGKHFFWWTKGELQTGFSANCIGDCPGDKQGWIAAGDHVRTTRVVGDVDSYLQSDKYFVASNIAYINFTCSILCNISEPTSRIRGHHLADITYCNLVFEVWMNDSVVDRINCTRPKGKYVYRHERYRDGHLIAHNYPLKKAFYQFRWVFNQADEFKSVSAAFEAKVFNISIVGVQGGSAISCTPCLPGHYSVAGNTDCNVCPKGTYSTAGASKCTTCKRGYFADTPGSGECLSCGAQTTSLETHEGCTTNGCKFIVEKGKIEYDLSRLSRVNGSMFMVLNYQADIPHGPEGLSRRVRQRRPSRPIRPSRLSVWPPYRQQFYLNLCTTQHDNSSCTSRATPRGVRESLPVMGCRSSWWTRDTSIGRVIGFKAKKDPASGVIVELLHGDICLRRKSGNQRFNSTIDLTCDVDAGVGNPGPENNFTNIFRPPCLFYFKWNSLYACPRCQKGDLEKVTHPCINGTVRVTYNRRVPCWGAVDGMDAGETFQNCSDVNVNFHHVRKIIKVQQTINTVLIGVGVVVIVALLIVAGYYFFKHRDFKYKYYGTLARNKPMSRLEEEEEDFGQVEGDVFNDTRTIINS